jgi:hypothetical protein
MCIASKNTTARETRNGLMSGSLGACGSRLVPAKWMVAIDYCVLQKKTDHIMVCLIYYFSLF